ncbi:MAG: phosphotransferase [Bacillus subtilis]|nr:phosphotransferase [Bacillus subtilis]
MESKSKVVVATEILKQLFEQAGIPGVIDIQPLGDGEYNALYSGTSQGKEYVVKIAPANAEHALTYEQGLMAHEVAMLRLISSKTSIKVPQIFAFDVSKKLIASDYFIMEKLPGTPLHHKDWTSQAKEQAWNRIVENVAELHQIKGDRYGYSQNGMHPNCASRITSDDFELDFGRRQIRTLLRKRQETASLRRRPSSHSRVRRIAAGSF